MLIRNTAVYALGRALPAAVSLLGLSLYTHLLSPEQYGRYALLLVCVGVANAVGFHWLRVAALRYLSGAGERRPAVLGALYSTYRYVALGAGGIALLALILVGDSEVRGLLVLGLLLLWCQTWFELNLDLRLAALEPVQYSILALARAILATLLGTLLAYLGYGPQGVAAGSAVGYLLPGIAGAPKEWRSAVFGKPDWTVVRQVLSFGLPLSGVSALSFFAGSVDRVLLGWVGGAVVVGHYAAASDLSVQSVTSLMTVVNLSAVPLAVRAYESGGHAAASARLREQAVVLLALAVPATIGLAVLAPDIAGVLLGDSFREPAAVLIPLIAVGAFLGGLKAYYFDLAFQLGAATIPLLRISVVAALLSLTLNALFIPRFGARGAAYAMIVTFGVACLLSAILGRRVFPLPVPMGALVRILGAAMLMAAALLSLPSLGVGVLPLALRIAGGAGVYAAVAVVLNVGEVRTHLARVLRT